MYICDTIVAMTYIVGLGNPGAKYAHTRHNIGWWVLDALVSAWSLSLPTAVKKCEARISEGIFEGEPVTLVYPETFMNNSGRAVGKVLAYSAPGEVIVVYDDVDLPAGTFKISYGNGAGGHNGVSSIIATLKTKDFVRVRVGVGKPTAEIGGLARPSSDELAAYVLATIPPQETILYESLVPKIVSAIGTIILSGHARAMNEFN